MTPLILVLAVLLVLALLLLGMFRYCMVRFRRPPKTELIAGVREEYRPLVREGIAWYRAQPTERVEITSYDGLRLVGLYLPAAQSKGCLLLMHGYRSSPYTDFGAAARYYHELGYDLLTVFQRSHGESEGRYLCFGVRERQDCRSWAEYLAQRFGPEKDIFLCGLSMGATTVLMATGLPLPESVRGVIADCGFTSPREEIGAVLRKLHLPRQPLLALLDGMARCFAGYGLDEASTLTALETNRPPVLFIHGGADDFVPTEMSRRNYAACRAEKELLIVPGAVHGVSYLEDMPAYRAALEAFLARWGRH